MQLKIENFYFDELHVFTSGITQVPILSDDYEFFRKCKKIWNKIIELIDINNPTDFIWTTLDDNADEFIMVDVEKNTNDIRDKYRNDLVFIFTSAFNDHPQTTLVQYRY